MQFNKRFSSFDLIWFGTLVLFSSHMHSALILRPLFNDGAAWLFNVLNQGEFHWDEVYERYVVLLPQVLPNLLLHLVPGRTDLSPEIYSFSFYYGLFPYVVLASIAFYLHKKNQISLFIFPLIHFVLIHCSAQSFYVNVATDASIVLWFAVMVFLLENNWKILVYSIPTLAFIWCGYELAPIYYGSLVLMLCYRYLIKKDLNKSTFIYCATIVSAICVTYIYKFIYLKKLSSSGHVNNHFMAGFLTFPMGIGLFSCLAIIAMFFSLFKSKKIKYVLWAVIVCAFIYCLYESSIYASKLFFSPYNARTTVYPRTFFLVIIFLLYDFFKPERSTLKLVLGLGLVLTIVENIRADIHWQMGLNKITEISNSNPGCILMTQNKFHSSLGRYGAVDWALPFLSTLNQKTKTPSSILFVERIGFEIKDQTTHPCVKNFNNTLISVGVFNVYIPMGFPDGFRYSFIPESNDFQIFAWKEDTKINETPIWESSKIKSQVHPFKKGVEYLLIVPLRGSLFKNELARAQITLPTGKVEEFNVSHERKNYQFRFTPTKDSEESIQVSFLNDRLDSSTGEDLNLYFGGAYLTPFKLDEPLLLQ